MPRPLKISDPAQYIQIGRNIAEIRRQLGMTLDTLADKTKFNQVDIAAWELIGVPPKLSLEALFCIAAALGVKAWGLLK